MKIFCVCVRACNWANGWTRLYVLFLQKILWWGSLHLASLLFTRAGFIFFSFIYFSIHSCFSLRFFFFSILLILVCLFVCLFAGSIIWKMYLCLVSFRFSFNQSCMHIRRKSFFLCLSRTSLCKFSLIYSLFFTFTALLLFLLLLYVQKFKANFVSNTPPAAVNT